MLIFIGAGKRNRTSDLLITNQLLYQLSYPGAGWKVYSRMGWSHKRYSFCREVWVNCVFGLDKDKNMAVQQVKRLLQLSSLCFVLVGCTVPTMQMQHYPNPQQQQQFKSLGTLTVNQFNDARPASELIVLKSIYTKPTAPLVFSSSANPSMPEFLQQVMIEEAGFSGLFSVKPTQAEYQLDGTIYSAFIAESMNDDVAYYTPMPGGGAVPRFGSHYIAAVDFGYTLKRNNKIIQTGRLKLHRSKPAEISFSVGQEVNQQAEFLDQVITAAVQQMLKNIADKQSN